MLRVIGRIKRNFLSRIMEPQADPNQIIPKRWEPPTSKQNITEFMWMHFSRYFKGRHEPQQPQGKGNKNSANPSLMNIPASELKKNLEIEIRFGKISPKTAQQGGRNQNLYEWKSKNQNFKECSLQNPLIIGTTDQEMKKLLRLDGTSQSCFKDFNYFFDPNMNYDFFFSRIRYLEERIKSDKTCGIDQQNLSSIDFCIDSNDRAINERVTMNISEGTFEYCCKKAKTNMDYMQQTFGKFLGPP
jgi:hypothetical protein